MIFFNAKKRREPQAEMLSAATARLALGFWALATEVVSGSLRKPMRREVISVAGIGGDRDQTWREAARRDFPFF
jgi:hypothetical protein